MDLRSSVQETIHYDPLMMSQKEAPKEHPWAMDASSLKDNYRCVLGASIY